MILRVLQDGFLLAIVGIEVGILGVDSVPVVAFQDAVVIGGPDIGNGAWATSSESVINQAITQSVDAVMNSSDGYFLFDMIHLKQKNQWQYVKTGIDKYLESVKK